MEQYISKSAVVAEIERLREEEYPCDTFEESTGYYNALDEVSSFLNTLEVKEVDLEEENENNNPKITAGTKIRLKTNPNIILSIISNDCHEDEFECSNGSVLSLKQIEKYYDIYIKEK